MLDVGCGTGQLCRSFAPHFKNIYGIDISESQLGIAKDINKDLSNVSFYIQNSYDLRDFHKCHMNGESIDLVTFGEVFHWFDSDSILTHYKDFISKEGFQSIFSYSTPKIMNKKLITSVRKNATNEGSEYNSIDVNFKFDAKEYLDQDEQAQEVYWEYYNKIKPHYAYDREHLDDHFQRVNFGKYGSNIEKYLYYDTIQLSLDDFVQYCKTSSGYTSYLKKFSNTQDPIEKLKNDLNEVYNVTEKQYDQVNSKKITVLYTYFLGLMKYK